MRTGKGFIVLLIVMFLAVVGMFVYSILYSSAKEINNYQTVYVVKETLLEGSSITENDVKELKIDKSVDVKGYLTSLEELGEKSKVNSTILANEIILLERIDKDAEIAEKHEFNIQFSNKVGIKEGDFVRVLVKPKYMSQVFEVLTVKEVQKVNFKKQNNGADTAILESVTVMVTEEEIALYEQAISSGDVILAKYNTVVNTDESYISFNEASQVIEKSIAQVREEGRKEGYFFVTLHQVEAGDTITALAEKYDVDASQIEAFNRTQLKEDSVIRVN